MLIFICDLLFDYMKAEDRYLFAYKKVVRAFYSYDKTAFFGIIQIIKVLEDKDLKRIYRGKYGVC